MKANRTTKTSIYIAVNSNKPCVEAPSYHTLQVGSALTHEHFGMIRDDDGENISKLNPSFCELTGLYWMWKHDNSHIVGLTHYRRYFAPRLQPGISFGDHEVAQASDFAELQEGIDILIPPPHHWRIAGDEVPQTLMHQYARAHTPYDIFLAREEVLLRTPEYKDAFDFVMTGNTIAHGNMFVGRKLVVDDYCEWLFPILFALEPLIPYEFYDPYQGRVFGFIAERLFNVWLCKNRRKYRILTRNVVRTEGTIL